MSDGFVLEIGDVPDALGGHRCALQVGDAHRNAIMLPFRVGCMCDDVTAEVAALLAVEST